MADDPKRLLDDPDTASGLRTDLSVAAAAVPVFDVTAGLARFEAAIAGPGAATDAPPDPSASIPPGAESVGAVGASAKASVATTAVAQATVATSATTTWVVGGGILAAGAVAGTLALQSPEPPAPAVAPPPVEKTVAPVVAPKAPVRPPVEQDVTSVEDLPIEPEAKPAPAAAQAAAPSEDRGERIRRELAQVAQARAALGANPAAALRLAEAGHRDFAGGMLYQEREAIAVLALARLGRGTAAKARGEQFLARYPRGPFSDQVRQAIGVK